MGGRRLFARLGAFGALTQTAYLVALAGSLLQDSPVDVEFVLFFVAIAAFFGMVSWLFLRAVDGRLHWATRILFALLVPVVLVLFFLSSEAWGEAEDWFDYLLAAAFTLSEGTMAVALPTVALSRSA